MSNICDTIQVVFIYGVCMKIRFERANDNLSFKRRLTAQELPRYTKAVKQGLKVLDKEVGVIVHNSSAPSRTFLNTGIGSLLSKTSEVFFIPFLASHGVSSIQQEPNYLRRKFDPSPYDCLSTSKNIYMIPLERLATAEYGNILDKSDFRTVVNSRANKETNKVNYSKIHHDYNKILRKSFENYLKKVNDDTLSKEEVQSLQVVLNKIEDLKSEKPLEMEAHALYPILAQKNHSEDWKSWNETDKNLYFEQTPNTIKRLNFLRKKYRHEIDFFVFKQALVELEIEKANSRNAEKGIKIIADTPVAFTPAEVWMNQDLFLDGLCLGCPPDYFSKNGQRWGFPVMNPETIFNKDGSLAKGGEFLKKRYEEIFKDAPGGVRIDHVIGLIDPFVYKDAEPLMNDLNSGRLYSSPEKPLFSKYTRYDEKDYFSMFEKIIFPAAEKMGVNKSDIIAEDLGELTSHVVNVIKKLGLPGLSIVQFGANGLSSPEKNVIMLGSHDNKSFIEYTDDFFNNHSDLNGNRDYFMYKTHILAADTVPYDKDENAYREEIRYDKSKFILASFVDMFVGNAKRIQIFFTDLFGIGETYNVPGTKKDCWTLRIPDNFEKVYSENLKKGQAVNFAEVLSVAIKHKGQEFVNKYSDLVKELENFAKILKQ